MPIAGTQRVDWRCRNCGGVDTQLIAPLPTPKDVERIRIVTEKMHLARCGSPTLEPQFAPLLLCPDCNINSADGRGYCANCGKRLTDDAFSANRLLRPALVAAAVFAAAILFLATRSC